jgi:hypothetical protein
MTYKLFILTLALVQCNATAHAHWNEHKTQPYTQRFSGEMQQPILTAVNTTPRTILVESEHTNLALYVIGNESLVKYVVSNSIYFGQTWLD